MNHKLIGAHVSAAGGTDKAVERAAAIGANCVQVFSGSPRVWARPKLDAVKKNKVFSKMAELHVEAIFTHSLYLVNLASENPELVRKSTEALTFDLHFDAKVKGSGVVVHVGSHQGRGWESVREQVAKAIAEIIEKTPDTSTFLIENAASLNGKIGNRLEEVKWLIDQLQTSRVGWCFDTCHGWAAGLSLDPTAEGSAISEMEKYDLIPHLKVIHVNDSRDPFGSGRDRHANLGDGEMPHKELKAFLTHPTLKDKPLVLEVPGIDNEGPDAENINRLKSLIE